MKKVPPSLPVTWPLHERDEAVHELHNYLGEIHAFLIELEQRVAAIETSVYRNWRHGKHDHLV